MPPAPSAPPAHPAASTLPPVLAESRSWLLFDKPAGLAIHPGPRTPHSLEQMLAALSPQRPPQPVHRLDRDTSGCLLVARRPAALRRLAAGFAGGQIHKLYWAIVSQPPAADSGRIEAALAKISTRADGWRMRPDIDGKAAVTGWEVIARQPGRALIAFRPETGRTHQIRVHATLMAAGAAIVGDPVYGTTDPLGMMLHARALDFPDPDAGDARRYIEAPLPARFRAAGFG